MFPVASEPSSEPSLAEQSSPQGQASSEPSPGHPVASGPPSAEASPAASSPHGEGSSDLPHSEYPAADAPSPAAPTAESAPSGSPEVSSSGPGMSEPAPSAGSPIDSGPAGHAASGAEEAVQGTEPPEEEYSVNGKAPDGFASAEPASARPAAPPQDTPVYAPQAEAEAETDAEVSPASAAGASSTAEPNEGRVAAAVVKGRIKVADDVVEKVATLAVMEVPGVAGLAGEPERGADQRRGADQGRDGGRRGLRVVVDDRQVAIDIGIVVWYGHVIMDVAGEVKANVAGAVSRMAGLRVTEVNVTVEDVRMPGARGPEAARPEPARPEPVRPGDGPRDILD